MVVGARAPARASVCLRDASLFPGQSEEHVWAGGDPDFVFSSFQQRWETLLQNQGTLGKQKPGPIVNSFSLLSPGTPSLPPSLPRSPTLSLPLQCHPVPL